MLNEGQHAPAWLRVAHIVRPQGHRGEVLAELLTDFPERFAREPRVSLRPAGAGEPTRTAVVEQFRRHGERIVFRLAGCASMGDAEALRNYDMLVPWAQRTPLAADEVYIADLAGCTLTDVRTGARVGVITDVDRETSATPLLIVEAELGGELLVPFVQAFEPRWDLGARTLHMRLPQGLTDPGEAVES